jgi:hypothetical protein
MADYLQISQQENEDAKHPRLHASLSDRMEKAVAIGTEIKPIPISRLIDFSTAHGAFHSHFLRSLNSPQTLY